MKSAISPSQKTGAEMPKSANPMAKRSKTVRRLIAEMTPIRTPTDSHMIDAPTISENVRGAFSMILSRIGTLESYEYPRPGQPYLSPTTIDFTNLPYCTYQGWSRPRLWRTSARFSGVGCLPTNRSAGSPGGSR